MSNKKLQLVADIMLVLLFAAMTSSVLGITLLSSPNTPTGGDTASHVFYAWRYSQDLLFSGDILPWMPEVFAGFPFLSYYFPLPFMVIAFLTKIIGFAPAFKWGSFAAAMLLPGLVHIAGRRWFALPWPASLLGALGAFAFLLHEQNPLWGGNLLAIFSGEFAYSYGLLFAVLACFAWSRAAEVKGGWIVAALLEAATGFSHGFTLLVTGFSTLLLFVEKEKFWRTVRMLTCGHALAFCLLGGWLWPMLEMHGYTIPNDAAFPLSSWKDLFPVSLRPVFIIGIVCLPICFLIKDIRDLITPLQVRAMRYLAGAATLACLGFLAGDQMGLADIRFFPMVWLFCAILCGWLAGFAISGLAASGKHYRIELQTLFTMALVFGMFGWIAQAVRVAPDWSLWNHAGLESKPQWHNLSRLFPALRGTSWSPRLLFEHDPANMDLGSTRTLEALPMFIGRPVLEGLYMESALIGPAVYQLQSEISASPSSPLVRFPSGSLDPGFAALHMRFLHADTVLLRSVSAKKGVEESGLFEKIAEAPPFAVYRLLEFPSRLAEVVTQPIKIRPLKNWMEDSFGWFRTRSKFLSYLPVYGAETTITAASSRTAVLEKELKRDHMHFTTDAIGKPHLIKVSWHPRWKLKSAGKLYLAGPGFMFVVPQERDIILEYGHTTAGLAGMAATFFSFAVIVFLLIRRKQRKNSSPQHDFPPPLQGKGRGGDGLFTVRFSIYLAAVAMACLWFATQSPEKSYSRAFTAFNAKRYDEASPLFQRAFERRRPQAKKEEALFWLAKSKELGGHKEEALKRYREIIDDYHGYWVPESLYTTVLLGRETGQAALVEPYAARLKDEYPNNRWARQLMELK